MRIIILQKRDCGQNLAAKFFQSKKEAAKQGITFKNLEPVYTLHSGDHVDIVENMHYPRKDVTRVYFNPPVTLYADPKTSAEIEDFVFDSALHDDHLDKVINARW